MLILFVTAYRKALAGTGVAAGSNSMRRLTFPPAVWTFFS
jgi:hypothetical protein